MKVLDIYNILTVVLVSLMSSIALAAIARENGDKVIYSHEKFNRESVIDDKLEADYIIELEDSVDDVNAYVQELIGNSGTIKYIYYQVFKGVAFTPTPMMTQIQMMNILNNHNVKNVSKVLIGIKN
jgi:hypothetical protein